MERLKVALVAGNLLDVTTTGWDIASGAGPIYSKCQKDMQELSQVLNFELIIYKDLMFKEQKAVEIRKDIDSKDIDFVMLFHPAYIRGDLVFELMKTKEETKWKVSRQVKQIRSHRTKLWSLVKNEEFEMAHLVKNEIKILQKQLLEILNGNEKN